MMDLFRLYLVNVMRPVFEDPKSRLGMRAAASDDDQDECDDEDDEVVSSTTATSEESEPSNGRGRKKTDTEEQGEEEEASGKSKGRGGGGKMCSRRGFKDIEILDLDGPKLIHGLRSWFVMYQIIGQLNWMGKPLYLSILYKSFLIPFCVYILWRDFLEPVTQTINLTDQFKNPIFVFISLSAAVTMLLHVILTFYNNLFNWCPMFKVLTTERLCFVSEEVQHIVGTNSMPSMMLFFALNTLLFRMCVARNLEDFIYQFDIGQFLVDFFVILTMGYHFIGVSYIDFYARFCFGMWIIAMKTNLEHRFAYLQKHQRSIQPRRGRGAVSLALSQEHSTSEHTVARLARQRPDSGQSRQSSIATTTEATTGARSSSTTGGGGGGAIVVVAAAAVAGSKNSKANGRLLSCSSSFSMADHMTLDEFKAKYKIDTLDEIQRNLNTMDDHLEVSREFQNNSLVLIALSAFLTVGALLLLAYNLLANQANYFHGVLMVLLAASYTICIFLCYIGDSWILYALEKFVQTVEDEYFLQSGGGGGEADDGTGDPQVEEGLNSTLPRRLGDDTISSYEPVQQTTRPQTAQVAPDQSDAGSEPAPTGQRAIAQSYQLFMIKKRDVLFCREFLYQFQNHLATPWSKLTVKIQLHMLGTFVTLIAAQIIFDHEH